MFTSRPHLIMRERSPGTVRRPRTALLALALSLGIVPLAGCGSDKKSTDTTVAAVDSTAEAAPDTTAATDTEATDTEAPDTAAADAAVPDTATAESAPADTTGDAGTETTVAGVAVTDADLKAGLAGFGVTSDEQVSCIKEKAGDSLSNLGGATPPTKFIKALIVCAPDALAAASSAQIKASIPGATDEQASCIAKATFKVLADLPDDEFEAAFKSGDTKNMPEALKKKAIEAAKDCGLSNEQLKKALES